MRKRSRACEECHRLKIKCDVGAAPERACDRCRRGGLACVPAAPRLQRDRIRELEAQVQALRTAAARRDHPTTLGSGGGGSSSSGTTPNWSSSSSSSGSAAGPRPEEERVGGGGNDDDADRASVLAFLDARIPPHRQQELLALVARQAGAAWPVVRLGRAPLAGLRAASPPVLLLAVLAYGPTQTAQGTDAAAHDALLRETARLLGREVLGRGRRSLDLVQALLVAAFWNKPTRDGGRQGSCYQLVQLAADMAIDLGLGGAALQPAPDAYFDRLADPGRLAARRAWLACFVAQATAALSTRRPSPVRWDGHHDACLAALEAGGGNGDGDSDDDDAADALLGQIVRVTRLIQDIAAELRLCQLTAFVDANDYGTHAIVDALARRVDDWAARVPPGLAASPTLRVWRHVAMVHLYEVVLHTPTNKAAFAAPFIPGRLAVHDFPRPGAIIPPLRAAFGALVGHCHAVIDAAAAMDPALVLGLPSFCFAPAVVYALFVLVTALVAATDPAGTYGPCLAPDRFRVEQCGHQLRRLAARVKALDPTLSCWATRMLDATSWLKEWHDDYNAILQRFKANLVH